jgi:hypothetical protein
MALPPLYKYLGVEGAKLTLGNNTFWHAKPSTFNDREDLTVAGMFPGSLEAALSDIVANLADVVLANLGKASTCPKLSMRRTVTKLQAIFRSNPKAAAIFAKQLRDNPGLLKLDVENVRLLAQSTINDVNEFMQDYRVLCVTTHKDSEKMWSGYAEDHKGIALRIQGSVAKDSKFQLFRPVTYRETRPTIYRDAVEFLVSSLFSDQDASKLKTMNDIIYTKTLAWQEESEYRLAIYCGRGEAVGEALKFHPEEITELYLGLAMDEADKADIIAKAKGLNPKIAVFQMKRGKDGKLGCDRSE